MTALFIHLSTVLGLLAAFWIGYKAGRKDERIIEQRIPDLDIIEDRALEEDKDIREDIKFARTIASGYELNDYEG